ncbi:MAG TPA: Xaa-Pro peptidase family protein [Geobacteraceae bacterium]|nr:Xaa-Pro peptidase family protein [Geobacteraceae bacterium]
MRITPASELENRCRRLQQYMTGEGLDAILIVQNADLFYFAGTIQSGILYVPPEGEPLYMVRKDFQRAGTESGLPRIARISSFKDIPSLLADYGYPQPERIGMELDVLPVSLYERYRKLFPRSECGDASPLIRKVRMIKSEYEIGLIRKAADQVDKICQRAREVIREGMSDLELAAELEFTIRKEGHQGLLRMRAFNGELFYAHVISGADSAAPSYMDTPLGGMGLTPAFGQGAGHRKIGREEPIIVDFAGCCDGYMADQTRVFAIGGISDRLRKGYDDMLLVQERMVALVLERPVWGDIYDECLALAVRLGYGDYFMGYSGAQVSFIGHGIGIEIDEYPFLARGFTDMRLEPGMVFAFEPKVVFPGEGAVGVENTFHLSCDGLIQLTHTDQNLQIL